MCLTIIHSRYLSKFQLKIMSSSLPTSIIFDGTCLMCNNFIILLDKNIKKPYYIYGDVNNFLQKYPESFNNHEKINISNLAKESIIVFHNESIFTHENAIIFLLCSSDSLLLRLLGSIIFRLKVFSIPGILYRIISFFRMKLNLLFKNNNCTLYHFKNLIICD